MWALLVILGFLAFAVGFIWFAWTVVRKRPIEQFPGGAGLLALAILGLIVLLIGIGIRPEAAPEPEEVTKAPDANFRGELAEVQGQLGAIQRDIDTVNRRLDKVDEGVLGLATSVARLEALESSDVPVVVDGPVTAISNEAVDTVDLLVLTLRNISRVAAFPLAGSSTRVSYFDGDQGVAVDFNEEDPGGAVNAWNARWTEGEGPNLSPGEAAEITISLLALDPRLTAGEEFIIEIELPGQPPMELIRTTPDELVPVMELVPKGKR
jgi:hypothetical protein